MPVERISREFKDISASFKVNPLSYDLIALKNETAIARSIRNLILTITGERPFQPVLGSGVSALLFDNMDSLTANAIKGEIETTIQNYEPRVKLRGIDVNVPKTRQGESIFDKHQFDVVITYDIVGLDKPMQQLNFALQPAR